MKNLSLQIKFLYEYYSRYINKIQGKKESLKKAQNNKIENVTGSV